MDTQLATDPGDNRPDEVRRLLPELADAAGSSYSFLASLVDPLIIELCRLRIAQIVGSVDLIGVAAAVGIDAGQRAELADWRDSMRFDAAQRACLEFVEYFCYSPESVTDEHVANLSPFLSAEQILSLTAALWVSDAFYRLSNFLKLLPDVAPPDASQA
jgi:alkylhydroperoxidase family enzyme